MIARCRHCLAAALVPLAACSHRTVLSEHADHGSVAVSGAVATQDLSIPAGAADVKARLAASPRHAEWVMIRTGPSDSVRAWVTYPERSTRAPVIVVVHEIFGLSTWIRGVADQLAADGFIAIVPDLLTGKYVPQGGPDSISVDTAMALIRTLKPDDVQRQLLAVAQYGTHLPAALPKYGIVGFCWGGGVSFAHATASPSLGASVVFYGVSPDSSKLPNVHAPVLGLYGGDDARVDMTIPPADSVLKRLGRTYDHEIFPGAGHGFLRDQAGRNGANLAAAREAWPRAIAWFRKYLGA